MLKNSTDRSAIESSNVVVQNPFTPDGEIPDAGLITIASEERSESAPETHSREAKTPQKSPKLSDQKLEKAARSAERQRLMRTIRNCAEKLAKVPSQFDLGEMTGITRHEIQKQFANYGLALRACGLEEAGARQDVETLFGDWARITRELGRTPTAGEYSMRSQFGEHPLRRRFGGWRAATQGMLLYAKENGRENELAGTTQTGAEEKHMGDTAMSDECMSQLASNLLPYGESLNPLPMAHGPRNETGVVFAFGMLAKELGIRNPVNADCVSRLRSPAQGGAGLVAASEN